MQGKAEDWTRKSLLDVLKSGSTEERLARLRRLGFLDEENKLTSKAESWGDRISHTEVEGDDEQPSAS